MIVEDRIKRNVDRTSDILRRLRLRGHVTVSIRKSSVPGEEMWVKLLGPERARDPVLDYRINFPPLSQEFAATFLFMLDEYSHQLWEERKRDLSQERLERFYKRILRLNEILSEFCKKASVPNFPSHILAIDSMYLEECGKVEGSSLG
jgi:hypothetical protein